MGNSIPFIRSKDAVANFVIVDPTEIYTNYIPWIDKIPMRSMDDEWVVAFEKSIEPRANIKMIIDEFIKSSPKPFVSVHLDDFFDGEWVNEWGLEGEGMRQASYKKQP